MASLTHDDIEARRDAWEIMQAHRLYSLQGIEIFRERECPDCLHPIRSEYRNYYVISSQNTATFHTWTDCPCGRHKDTDPYKNR